MSNENYRVSRHLSWQLRNFLPAFHFLTHGDKAWLLLSAQFYDAQRKHLTGTKMVKQIGNDWQEMLLSTLSCKWLWIPI